MGINRDPAHSVRVAVDSVSCGQLCQFTSSYHRTLQLTQRPPLAINYLDIRLS